MKKLWLGIAEVLMVYRRRIEARQIDVERNFQAAAQLTASSGELRQIFSNLILNAVDALTPGGILKVSVGTQLNGAGELLRVEIQDNGVGIPPENLNKIFDPFFITKKDVGTGLGLWSARSLVEKHDGQLLVNSSEGRTSFIVLLPLRGDQQELNHAVA